jgi:hypothetical protein
MRGTPVVIQRAKPRPSSLRPLNVTPGISVWTSGAPDSAGSVERFGVPVDMNDFLIYEVSMKAL